MGPSTKQRAVSECSCQESHQQGLLMPNLTCELHGIALDKCFAGLVVPTLQSA